MEQVALEVSLRKPSGKGGARSLRRAEQIPAIFYGPDSEAMAISVARTSLEKILKKQSSENTLYQLTIKGGEADSVKTVMLKDLQQTPLDREILHADFLEVSLTKAIEVTIGLKVTGKAPGVEQGGILQEISRELEVRCLPTQIPDFIELDVSALEIGDSIHVQDLKLAEGILVLSEPRLTLVTVVAQMEEKPEAKEGAGESVEVVAKKGKGKTEEAG
jgi:large subunit ribosomal protein L25